MSIPTSFAVKHYSSAHQRLLHSTVAQFFDTNFPKFFGPKIRERIAEQLLEMIDLQCPAATALQPGQCVWNAVAIETRAGSAKQRLIPVVLTLVSEEDIRRRTNGEKLSSITPHAVARVLDEAYQQGALLSMRDLALLVWHSDGQMTTCRQAWEKANERILPHPGSLQDMGSCITHKVAIVVKTVYERKDTREVMRDTHHCQKSVERYIRDFHRVRTCYRDHPDLDFICRVTGMSEFLVAQYLDIIRTYEYSESPSAGKAEQDCAILPSACSEDRATLGSDPSADRTVDRKGDTMSP